MVRTVLCMLCLVLCALPVGRAGAADVDAAIGRLLPRLELAAAQPQIAGLAVVVVSPDATVMQRIFGVREVGGAPIDEDTRFRIASLSKGFSSTVAGMLVTEGKLAWGDRVIEDVDYFTLTSPTQSRKATIEHLLSHRTGLPYNAYDNLLEANWAPDRIVQRYGEVKPLCEVGTCYGYQNITYNLINEIVERRTEHTFEDEVTTRLFGPLAMRDAGFGAEHLQRDENYARPHLKVRGNRLAERRIRTHYYRVPAAAGINLDVDDLATWLRAQLAAFPDVVPQDLLTELRQPRVFTRREMRSGWRRARLDGAWYGLGWRIYDYAGHTMVYHAGAVEGYQAALAVFPAEQVAIAAMWNSNSSRPWGIVPEFADALYGLRSEDWMKLDQRRGGRGATAAAGE